MKYLADTHILLWSFFEPKRLSNTVQGILRDDANEIYYSPVSLWEISIKYSLNKLHLNGVTPEEFHTALEESFFLCRQVESFTAVTTFHLPIRHKDPFDRFLVWEAIKNNFTLLSADSAITVYQQDGLKIVQ
jgi:PIN domain nuclease of toxin-antitoxin system